MQKYYRLLAFLVLTLGCSASYAEATTLEGTHHYIRNTSIIRSPVPNKYDGMGTTITVYSLIIGAYALYWFKPKA
jgi:hypothetical protein